MSGHFEQFGKYILLEKLATGGMAEVFLARGSGAGGIGKFFAIKRILPQYADSPEFIDMFKDEAKIAINLNHSNIVSIHEFGVEKGQFFLVMDYVEGRNLRQILNKMKKTSTQFSIDQIIFIIKEVAAGLDHAHRCIDGTTGKPLNITHRDMSPQNVMVSFEGEVKIVDFGIAKAESQIENTRAGTLKGKFGYMSPEQAEGQPVDLRTDIFSLGIVLWELLAGDRLFVANNEINTLRKIRDCQIPSLRKINPNIHTELERIVQKALARDRNLRYQTGAALHRDLNRFLNRQYPDFSTQDFSVHVKSVFSDEILALRKRLLEYAKVNVAATFSSANRQDRVDNTSLVGTDTNSAVPLTSSEISQAASQVQHEPDNRTEFVTESAGAVSAPDLKRAEDDSLVTSEHDLSQPDRSSLSLEIRTDVTADHAAAKPPGQSSPILLDEKALNKALDPKTVNPRVHPMDTKPHDLPPVEMKAAEPELRSASVRPSTRSANARSSRPSVRHHSPAPVRWGTVAAFLAICLALYTYSAKRFPAAMAPLVGAAQPYFGWLHATLGINPQSIQETPPTAVQPAPRKPAPDIVENSPVGLVVTSNPSGAEIIVNEQPTGMVTPSRIEVSGVFSIRIKKKGYEEFKVEDASRESIGHRLDATLVKMNVAYLDIEIFPPQPATVYVNGKQYAIRRSSVREIPVPGGIPVKVRAESVGANTFEEMIVTVPTDKRKAVQLNPRKSTRQPTSSRGLQQK